MLEKFRANVLKATFQRNIQATILPNGISLTSTSTSRQGAPIKILKAVCFKDQLKSCNIEKTDFPKLCQNKGLGELVLKIYVSGRLGFYLFFWNFFFRSFALVAA